MNARTKEAPPQTYSAQALADMPLAAARDALRSQECAFMQEKHGARILQQINADALEYVENSAIYGRVTCFNLQGRVFVWEAVGECVTCDSVGKLFSTAGEPRDCPDCKQCEADLFYTDYDGSLITEPSE